MSAKTVVTIGFSLFVATSIIELVLKGATDVRSSTFSQNGCGCIAVPQANPQMNFPTTAQLTFPKEGVAALFPPGDTLCPTCRKIEPMAEEEVVTTSFGKEPNQAASSTDVQEGISSGLTEGLQQ